MSLPALYTLAAQYRELAEKLADADLDAQTVADTIEASGLTDDIAVKAQNIEMVARSAEAHQEAIDAEIKRLTTLKKHRAKVAAGLRQYVLENMVACGIEKIECPLFTVKRRANPPSVEVFQSELVPLEYMRVPPPEVNKTAIAAALKAGHDVPGCKLNQTERLEVK